MAIKVTDALEWSVINFEAAFLLIEASRNGMNGITTLKFKADEGGGGSAPDELTIRVGPWAGGSGQEIDCFKETGLALCVSPRQKLRPGGKVQ